MEETKVLVRTRGNIKSTTKGEFTVDATVEISNVEITGLSSEEISAKTKEYMDKLLETLKTAGEQAGLTFAKSE